MVQLLVDNKADVDLATNVTIQLNLLVTCSVESYYVQCSILHLLFQNKFGDTALTRVCYRGHTEIADLLVERGANVNYMDKVRQHHFIMTGSL